MYWNQILIHNTCYPEIESNHVWKVLCVVSEALVPDTVMRYVGPRRLIYQKKISHETEFYKDNNAKMF